MPVQAGMRATRTTATLVIISPDVAHSRTDVKRRRYFTRVKLSGERAQCHLLITKNTVF